MPNLYDPQVIKRLFDEMAGTYGWVNVLSSFGFCWRWRRQCLQTIRIPAGAHVIDLMTGMGELCPDLGRRAGAAGRIVALDISESMCREASKRELDCTLEVIQTDVLTHGFESASADVVVSSFGLKTFSPQQIEALAAIVARVLKLGGVFSFVEISVPRWSWLRAPYMLYVNYVVPLIGFLFLGNPDNYRQLGVYTAAFQNCQKTLDEFRAAGLEVQYHSFFFGCATAVSGHRVAGNV
ncbi:MAG: Methyltransferase type 11 [Phycisphaerales bacterium]|nr:Methyltransferase type 11 [Phycisphaerales bacterium]